MVLCSVLSVYNSAYCRTVLVLMIMFFKHIHSPPDCISSACLQLGCSIIFHKRYLTKTNYRLRTFSSHVFKSESGVGQHRSFAAVKQCFCVAFLFQSCVCICRKFLRSFICQRPRIASSVNLASCLCSVLLQQAGLFIFLSGWVPYNCVRYRRLQNVTNALLRIARANSG